MIYPKATCARPLEEQLVMAWQHSDRWQARYDKSRRRVTELEKRVQELEKRVKK